MGRLAGSEEGMGSSPGSVAGKSLGKSSSTSPMVKEEALLRSINSTKSINFPLEQLTGRGTTVAVCGDH